MLAYDKNLMNFVLKLFFVYTENVQAHGCCRRSTVGKKRLCRSDNTKQTKVPKCTDSKYDSADISTVKGW